MDKILSKLIFAFFILTLMNVGFGQELVLVERIKLESPDGALKVRLFNDIFFVMSSECFLYSFNKKGKLINTIVKKGQGPGEFIFMRDFCINEKGNILVGGMDDKKIAVLDSNGKLLNEHKVDCRVDNVFFIKNKIYYSSVDYVYDEVMKDRKKRFEHQILHLFTFGEKKYIFSITDKSQINPHYPISGNSYPVPWFPAPFSNRITIIPGEETGSFYVFQTRRNFLMQLNGTESRRIFFDFDLKPDKVSDKDKNAFFTHMETVNERKFPEKTKKSIRFPLKKEYFLSVVKWNKNYALVTGDSFLVINRNGKLKYKMKLPRIDKKYINIYGNFIDIYKNHLYFLSDDAIIQKYLIKK